LEAGRPAQDVRSGTIAGIIDGMPGSEASPVFVGRDAELEFLERALDVAVGGATGTVLVGAESGVGKSRLISQFAAKARDRALVLAGGCVEVGTALPYAPVTALLRMLVRSRGAGEVAALLPGNQVAELSVLLPEFGEQPSGGHKQVGQPLLEPGLIGQAIGGPPTRGRGWTSAPRRTSARRAAPTRDGGPPRRTPPSGKRGSRPG